MRIAYVITRADEIGGAQIHVRDFAARLRRAGHDATVFAGAPGLLGDQLRGLGIPLVEIPALSRDPNALRDAAACVQLRGALRAYRPQLVSAHCAKAGLIARLAARSLHLPTLLTVHGWAFADGAPRFQRLLSRWTERLAAPLAKRIIVVSDYDRRIASRYRVVPARRVQVIHNGMPDIPPAARAKPETEAGRIVMIGRFTDQKDHATLFRALAGLVDRSWHLELIGDGPQRDRAARLADRLGLAKRVSFLGWRTDVDRRLAGAQIYALISRWEGFPRSILEAMRAGLPVVASDVGGVAEAVADGSTGFVVPAENVVALAERLQQLLEAPELRVMLGKNGRVRYETEFTFERMFEQTAAVYRQVIGEAA